MCILNTPLGGKSNLNMQVYGLGIEFRIEIASLLLLSVQEWRIFDSMVPLPPIQPVEAVSVLSEQCLGLSGLAR